VPDTAILTAEPSTRRPIRFEARACVLRGRWATHVDHCGGGAPGGQAGHEHLPLSNESMLARGRSWTGVSTVPPVSGGDQLASGTLTRQLDFVACDDALQERLRDAQGRRIANAKFTTARTASTGSGHQALRATMPDAPMIEPRWVRIVSARGADHPKREQAMNKTTKIVLLVVAGALLLCGLGSAATVGIGAISGALAWKNAADRVTAERAAVEAQRQASEERLSRLQREFDSAKKKEEALAERLSSARDEAERHTLEMELDKARRERQAAASTLGGAQPKPPGEHECGCSPGDPLCACD